MPGARSRSARPRSQQIIAQGVAEAQARSRCPPTIAVVDRVGNVLAVFAMTGANPRLAGAARARTAALHDLQGVDVPGAVAGAIAKAITGAYLSSGGNAFSTRTASMIVQEHFPPSAAARGLESGPLFGVQFSQLPCSDLAARFNGNVGAAGFIGPKRSPLGLAADPGGFPLYKNGVLVGGVGVMADGVYGFDPDVQDVDKDARGDRSRSPPRTGFAAPDEIRAERISVDGTLLRFSDATPATCARIPPPRRPSRRSTARRRARPRCAAITTRRWACSPAAPTAARRRASGRRPPPNSRTPTPSSCRNGAGANRYPVRAGTDGAAHRRRSAPPCSRKRSR